MFIIHKILLLILLLTCSSTYAENSYHVGYQQIEVKVKQTSEAFPIAVVYPTLTPEKNVMFGPFKLKLAIGAFVAKPTANGKFPLVIISHGSGGTNLGHRSIAFSLVKKGFVVAMPLHPKNNYKDNSAEGTNNNWINRPKHIKLTIDSIISNSNLSKAVDSNNIGIIGHSAGGYTALAVAGGIADTKHIFDLCKNHAKHNQVFCEIGEELPSNFIFGKIENTRDDRIKAIVLMAPVGVLFKSENSLAKVNAPLLLLKAEKDNQLTEPHHSDVIEKNYLYKEKLSFSTVKNAGHYSFITPFPKSISSQLGKVAKDPKGFDRDFFDKKLSENITEYLIKNLK